MKKAAPLTRLSNEVAESETDGTSAFLRIHRRANPWRDKLIDYAVEADGQFVGTVAHGKSEEFSLPAGEHSLRLRTLGALWDKPSRLYTSAVRTIAAADGEVIDVVCGPNGPAFFALIGLLVPRRWISLEGPRRRHLA